MHPSIEPEDLLALGSAGLERQRLDRYSDLDFFVIVAQGYKVHYIESLDWLADGHKALMTDGIFCEFAVFEP
jgi:hypothetical protein